MTQDTQIVLPFASIRGKTSAILILAFAMGLRLRFEANFV